MASPYRDATEAVRSRIAALDEQIAELERSWTPVFWEEVAPRYSLAPPSELVSPPGGADAEALMRAAAEREERLLALGRVTSAYREIEAWWLIPSPEPPPLRLLTETLSVRWNRPFKSSGSGLKAFTDTVQTLELDLEIRKLKPNGLGAVVEVDGVPYGVTYQGWSTSNSADQEPLNMVTVRVPPGAAPLQLKPQNIGDEIMTMLRLRQDIVLNHQHFDGYFLVQGDTAAAKAMLTPAVCDRLLQIAHDDIPGLDVSQGLARLWWLYDLKRSSLDAAIKALRLIREAQPTRALRRG